MEIIRRDTDYAIRAVLQLAVSPEETMSCTELAKATGIPRSFAHKILKKMAGAGIVSSRGGRAGGYRLRESWGRTSLRAIVEAVQGPVTVSECVLDPTTCRRGDDCPVSAEWSKLQDSIVGFLDQTTLQNMIAAVRPARKRSRKK